MTKQEIDARLQELNEQQLQHAATMSESDAHASKCIKLGLNFQETYPSDYEAYIKAREAYNANEQEIAELEAMIPDVDAVEELT